LLSPPFAPVYSYDQTYRDREASPQVIVQPIVTQTQIVAQAPIYEPVRVRCARPLVIEIRPSRGKAKTPNVIYGGPDPCSVRAAY
jgi:hypothetical protein